MDAVRRALPCAGPGDPGAEFRHPVHRHGRGDARTPAKFSRVSAGSNFVSILLYRISTPTSRFFTGFQIDRVPICHVAKSGLQPALLTSAPPTRFLMGLCVD